MKIKIWLFFLFFSLNSYCQKQDYNWLAGWDSYAGYDTGWHYWFGTTQFNFNSEPMAMMRDSLSINFDFSNAAISDSNGNILFYCNGVQINNYLDELIENGDSLGEGYFLDTVYSYGYSYGMPNPQYFLILENPTVQYNYDIFSTWIDTISDGDLAYKKILRTTLNMNTNSGKGSVTNKNISILDHEINFAITAVRHGNGRDWWLCAGLIGTNCLDIMLYDGSDSVSSNVYCGGVSCLQDYNITSLRFSTDGQWLASASSSGTIGFYGFDRCTGTPDFKDSLYIPEIVDSTWWPWDLEFSPSGRYVYIFCSSKIFQFDMLASPVSASLYTVATYSGFNGPFPQTYYDAQLAPDGKIYVGSGNGNYYVGVIDSPDLPGASCKFLDHSIQVPTFIDGLDYFPNYRLGALTAAGCDSLTGISEDLRAAKEKIIKVFPNPASDYTVVDYGFTDWSKGAVQMKILDALGEIINTTNLPMYSGFQRLDISNFASGIYFVEIVRSGDVIGAAKFVKE